MFPQALFRTHDGVRDQVVALGRLAFGPTFSLDSPYAVVHLRLGGSVGEAVAGTTSSSPYVGGCSLCFYLYQPCWAQDREAVAGTEHSGHCVGGGRQIPICFPVLLEHWEEGSAQNP